MALGKTLADKLSGDSPLPVRFPVGLPLFR